jgi:hypothetical protein
MEREFTFESAGYRCVAIRSDRSWGHGLDVKIVGDDDQVLNTIYFSCHPEFPSHDILQAMSTEQLVELAAKSISRAEFQTALLGARTVNLKLYMAFQIPPET